METYCRFCSSAYRLYSGLLWWSHSLHDRWYKTRWIILQRWKLKWCIFWIWRSKFNFQFFWVDLLLTTDCKQLQKYMMMITITLVGRARTETALLPKTALFPDWYYSLPVYLTQPMFTVTSLWGGERNTLPTPKSSLDFFSNSTAGRRLTFTSFELFKNG